VVGTLTNTVLVLGLIGLRGYVPWPILVTAGLTNGLLEIVTAVLITLAVSKPAGVRKSSREKVLIHGTVDEMASRARRRDCVYQRLGLTLD